MERAKKRTRDGEKYKDVKTNGVCERKMRKKSVLRFPASTSEEVCGREQNRE